MRKAFWLLLLGTLMVAPGAWAQDDKSADYEPPDPGVTESSGDSFDVVMGQKDKVMATGAGHLLSIWRLRYTFWFEQRGPFPVDTPGEGTEVEDGTLGLQQLDFNMSYSWAPWGRIEVGLRAYQGMLFGKQSTLGGDEVHRQADLGDLEPSEHVIPRALFAEFLTPVGLLRIGHQTSHWGLGMLANDSVTQRTLDIFNNRTRGDLVERILFATKPAGFGGPIEPGSLADGFLLGLGFDVVFADENADLIDGDVAIQGILSLILRDAMKQDWEVGFYGVLRSQTYKNDDELLVTALNLFARIRGDIAGGAMPLKGEVAIENTWTVGQTNRLSPEESPEEASVNAFGLAFEGLLEVPDPNIIFGVKAGISTGDANLDDPTVYRFSFDPDYKAGLILFDQVLLETTARSYEKATDPARSAVPPKGVQNFISQGSINSTLFINPMILFRPIPDITFALGGLWARATSPLIDPIETFRAGGEPTNPFGTATDDRSLGFEVDLLLSYVYPIPLPDGLELPLRARAEYGAFFYGGAFARPDGTRPETIHYVSAQLSIGW